MPRKFRTNVHKLPSPKGHYVYAYLRTNSNVPYYIGQGGRPDRMTGRHSCPVPTDRSRIRVLREGLDQAGADFWETFYIARYGMKSEGGLLMNRRTGGLHGGGSPDDELREQISQKVKALHDDGVFARLNDPKTIARRATQRAMNQAAAHGIPLDAYLLMDRSERRVAKAWLKGNPESTYEDFLATRRSAAAAAKYGVPLETWNGLTFTQKNGLKEYCNRVPGRNGMDYLNGHRATPGKKRSIDPDSVRAMAADGMTRAAIARALDCNASTISRILSGKRLAGPRTGLIAA